MAPRPDPDPAPAAGRRPHLGIVATLPPVPTGPADYVARSLEALQRVAEVTCFVDDPAAVDAELRSRHRVRSLAEREDPAVDLLIYHLANNHWQAPAVDAALDGPPGLVTLHDVSQHHLLEYRLLGHGDPDRWRRVYRAAHGHDGAVLGRLRVAGAGFETERFLFDMLRPVLVRHRGVIVHNRWAAEVVGMRVPGLPVSTVPLFCPSPPVHPPMGRDQLGLPAGRLLVGHFGYVTPPKRPELLVEAFERLLRAGTDAHLVLAGDVHPVVLETLREHLDAELLRGRVTMTGYLDRDRMDALMHAVDIVVSLRWPHLGESSGTVNEALAAGRPVVVQGVGSWAELPDDVAAKAGVGDDEAGELATVLLDLRDPARRERLGAGARAYAQTILSPDHYAAGVLAAAQEALQRGPAPPLGGDERRRREATVFLQHGRSALAAGGSDGSDGGSDPAIDTELAILRAVPAGGDRQRLLAIGASERLRRSLSVVWGYDVVVAGAEAGAGSGFTVPDPGPGQFRVVVHASGARLDRAGLAEVNRLLAAGGRLVLAGGAAEEAALDVAGFATGPLESDLLTPATAEWPALGGVLVARKAALPLAPDL